MLNQMETVVVRQMPQLETVVVTVRGNSYGSLELDKLAQLQADLAATRELIAGGQQRVVIDLAGVSTMGSSFLSELISWVGKLGCGPSRVVVCGDQTGLLKLCATDRWLTVCEDLSAALTQLCTRPAVASPSTGRFVLAQ